MKKRLDKNRQAGFTIMELMISVSLFATIVGVSTGALVIILQSNNNARSSKTVVDNLNITVENMVRTIRYGTNYHCGAGFPLTTPLNCNAGDTQLALNFNARTHVYKYDSTNKSILYSSNGGGTWSRITSSDTKIDTFKVFVFGAGNTAPNELIQPYVVIIINGHVGSRPTEESNFFIQTTASARNLDVPTP